jgi:ATP-dependent Clp protease protease subunit
MNRKIHNILAHHTGQPAERIAADFERDRYLTAQEAVDYGLVDETLPGPEGIPEGPSSSDIDLSEDHADAS